MSETSLIIAIDRETNAVAIVSVSEEHLPKLVKEFREIKHIKEIRNNPENYLREYFKPALEKAMRKYPLEIEYFPKVDRYFWDYIEYLAKWSVELIVDDGLWQAFVDKYSSTQISLVKEGNVRKAIRELKQELRKAKQEKDVVREEEIWTQLEIERQRRVLILIADNYLHLRKRGIKLRKH